jgi:long-chain acyl-CoA synthetase
MEPTWLQHYPQGVPASVDVDAYGSLAELLDEAFDHHRDKVAYRFMGKAITFAEVNRASTALGAYLQSLGLERGDRVAVMMPNVPQYPVAIAAILRAGFVLVNVNPLYTRRELKHQLQDSGAKAIIILENFATTLQQVAAEVPTRHVVLASMGDMLGLKGLVVNHVVRKVKKLVPAFDLRGAVGSRQRCARVQRCASSQRLPALMTWRCCSTPAAPRA